MPLSAHGKLYVFFLFMNIIKASQRRDVIYRVSSAQAAAAAGMCCMLEAVANSFPSFCNI